MLRIEGASVWLGERLVWTDSAPVADALVVGPLLVCGGASKRLVGVDVASGALVYSVTLPRRVALVAALGADHVVCADAVGSVRALEWRTGAGLRDLFGHFSPVTALAVLDARRLIVTADADCLVRVSPVDEPRNVLFYLTGHLSPVVSLVVSTRATEAHLLGSVSSHGEVLWHSLVDGTSAGHHPFATVEQGFFKRPKKG